MHVGMEKLNFTCKGLKKCACENGKAGFHMSVVWKSEHVRMEKLDFTCRWLGKRACENGKAGFHMQGFGKVCMWEWENWISHARV